MVSETMRHAGVSETWPTIKQAELIDLTGRKTFTGWCQPVEGERCADVGYSTSASGFWAGSQHFWWWRMGAVIIATCWRWAFLNSDKNGCLGSYIWPWTLWAEILPQLVKKWAHYRCNFSKCLYISVTDRGNKSIVFSLNQCICWHWTCSVNRTMWQ